MKGLLQTRRWWHALRAWWLAALLGAGLASAALAQRPALRVYTIDDGLKFSQVFAVFQDSRGFIWAGTSYGTGRYDGRAFANLTTGEGLPHDSVKAFAEDGEGLIWVLTQEGPAVLRATDASNGSPLVVPLPEGARSLAGRKFTSMAGGRGAVWFAEGKEVLRWRGGRLERVVAGITGNLRGVYPIGAEDAFVATDSGLFRVKGLAPTPVAVPASVGAVAGVVSLGEAVLLVGERGVARGEGSGFALDPAWRVPEGFAAEAASAGKDCLVLTSGTRGAAVLEKGKATVVIDGDHGLPGNGAMGAIVDRDGLIWLATEDGLVKVLNLRLRSWLTQRGGLGGMVLSFAREFGGPLWVGHTDGVSRLEADGRLVPMASGRDVGEAWALLALPGGTLLVGTPDGLAVVEGGRARRLRVPPELGGRRIFGLASDPQGRVWVAALGGVTRFRWDRARHAPADLERMVPGSDEDCSACEARGLSIAKDGTVWIGTDGQGVLAFSKGGLRRFGLAEGLPSLVCRAVLARPEGVWVGTDKGLWRLSGGRAEAMDTVNSTLGDRYIVALAAEAQSDAVWVACSYSVVRVRGERVEAILDHSRGLAGPSTTAEHCLLAEPGRLWVGMAGGFSEADAVAAVRLPPPPAVGVLAALDGEGRRVAPGGRLAFPIHDLSVSFFSPTYHAEETTRFLYRLAGYDERWSDPQWERKAHFTNLFPGSYVFEVRAVAPDGRGSLEPARVPFEVEVPWGLAFAALGTLVVLTAAAAWAVSGVRTRRVRTRNEQLERQVAERTALLAKANQRLELLAATDGLTGIANRRVFQDHLQGEWNRALRAGTDLSLLMIDVDFFKAYNDALGHQQGDEGLRRVAAAVAAHAERPGDLAARYGGEEFVVVLPGAGAEGARAVAEDIRAAVAAMALLHPKSSVADHVTVSIGAATRRPAHQDASRDLVAAADEALYRAKQEGRDRVVVGAGSEK